MVLKDMFDKNLLNCVHTLPIYIYMYVYINYILQKMNRKRDREKNVKTISIQ